MLRAKRTSCSSLCRGTKTRCSCRSFLPQSADVGDWCPQVACKHYNWILNYHVVLHRRSKFLLKHIIWSAYLVFHSQIDVQVLWTAKGGSNLVNVGCLAVNTEHPVLAYRLKIWYSVIFRTTSTDTYLLCKACCYYLLENIVMLFH